MILETSAEIPDTSAPVRRKTLTRATLWQVALGVILVIALASAVSHRLIYNQIEQRVIAQLNQYVIQRSKTEDEVFRLARDMQLVIRQTVLASMTSYRTDQAFTRFDELFMRHPDGAIRSRPEQLEAAAPVSGWLHRDTPLTAELRQRMVLFHDIVQQFKPSTLVRFADIYFTAPEQLSLGTDPPGLTLWAMSVAADFDQNREEWLTIVDRAHNPTRQTTWTGVYIDPVWEKPMVTVATPIDYAGRHIGNINFDHLLDSLIETLLATGLPGARHVVFQADGRLIAHSEKMSEIEAVRGQYFIQSAGDSELVALFNAVQGGRNGTFSGFDEASDQYYSISRLTGPSWYYASSIPGRAVRAQAFASAQWVLWSGLGSFALLVPVLAMILRRQIALPLARLTIAAEKIAAGEQITHLSDDDFEELARLVQGFNHMSDQVTERDAALRVEKRELQESLTAQRNTEERWRAMTEHLSDFIVVLDRDLRNIYVSSNMNSILGYAPEERLGHTGFDLVHPEDLPALQQQIQTAWNSPATSTHLLRYRMRCKDRSYKYLEATWTNLLDNPAVRGIVSNVRDVTDIVRAEQEIAQQKETLHQAEKLSAMGSLLAGVAHELNNPLSVVVGRAIMLEEQALEPNTRSSAQKIRAAAERCARIVKSFLAMARQQKPNYAAVQIEHVLAAALDMVEYGLRSQGTLIERNVEPALPPLSADADQLHQVFTNLFVNAQHAMAEVTGLRKLIINARRSHDGTQVIAEVIDTGAGMPPEVLARAFDPFFTTKPMGKGTGVGLAVSWGIVQAHGGTMTAERTEAGGTCITVTLPLGKIEEAILSVPLANADTDGRHRILVVDDEEEITAILADILTADGHHIDIARGGREALALIALRTYGVIVTDLRMPDLDGRGLFAEIQRRWPPLAGKVIFITGDNLSLGIKEFLAQCARPLIEKPFVPAEVRRVVASVNA